MDKDYCLTCKLERRKGQTKCLKCSNHQINKHEDISSNKKLPNKIKYCYRCRQQNNFTNTNCGSCFFSFINKSFPTKTFQIFKAGNIKSLVYCEECGHQMEQCPFLKLTTATQSYSDYTCPKCSIKDGPKNKMCLFCNKYLNNLEKNTHDSACLQRAMFFTIFSNPVLQRCTKRQTKAIYHIYNKCQLLHQEKKHMVYYRMKKLGFDEKDIQNLHRYIIHQAPIIIHVNLQKSLRYYLRDTNYRNQFQVNRSCPERLESQNRLFDKLYHTSSAYERVKYGVMNLYKDPRGVSECQGYGQSYFVLKQHIRDRCTITDMDSTSPIASIGTLRFFFHLLIKFSDAQLVAIMECSKNKPVRQMGAFTIKQIQIHGPIQFETDIQSVKVCRQQIQGDQNLLKMLRQFCDKNKLEFELFDSRSINYAHEQQLIKQKGTVENEPQRQQPRHLNIKHHPIRKDKKKR